MPTTAEPAASWTLRIALESSSRMDIVAGAPSRVARRPRTGADRRAGRSVSVVSCKSQHTTDSSAMQVPSGRMAGVTEPAVRRRTADRPRGRPGPGRRSLVPARRRRAPRRPAPVRRAARRAAGHRPEHPDRPPAAPRARADPRRRRPTRRGRLGWSTALTGDGRDLASALRLLADWGSRRTGGEPLRHDRCGTPVEARWFCPTCARRGQRRRDQRRRRDRDV